MSAALESAGSLSYLLAALLAALPFGSGEATALTGGLLTAGTDHHPASPRKDTSWTQF